MNQPPMDDNRMAALLDGRLSERGRDDAVAHLSASDEDAARFADAAAILRELEAEDAAAPAPVADTPAPPVSPHTDDPDTGSDGKVVPFRPPSVAGTRPRRMPARWLALAAVLAGVLLVPLALSRSGSGGLASPSQYAVLLSDREKGLPTGWTPGWSGTRGGVAGEPVVDDRTSARFGALHVDLALAIAGRQTEKIDSLAGYIAAQLVNVPASGVIIPYYQDIAARAGGDPGQLADALDEAEEALEGFVEADYFAAGGWAEAARFAAHRRDVEFFRSGASRRAMDRAASLSAEARAAVDAIRAASQTQGAPDWNALSIQTDALLAHLTR